MQKLRPPKVHILTLLAVALITNHLAWAAQAQVNDCNDPYWIDSLRCAADSAPGTLVPQPTPNEPLTPSDIKEFTRVDLDGNANLRCADGTVPVIYVDAAAGGPSNDWVFTVPGGGSCSANDDGLGNLTNGQNCLDKYLSSENGEMGTATQSATRNMGTVPGGSNGIHSPDLVDNPFFAGFNRVRVQKCSYDRYNGRSTRTVDGVHPQHGNISFELYQHGQWIFLAAFEALRNGLTYDLYEGDGMGGVTKTVGGAALPPLESASRVLLAGHSGSTYGMFFNADRLNDHLSNWPGFSADVRALLDANYSPAVENEAAFATPVLGDLYDQVLTGTSPTVAPTTGVYDASFFSDPMSIHREQYAAYLQPTDGPEDVFDASCVATHPGMLWICSDRYHVLFNHITTPMFIREDLSDPSSPHTADGIGHLVPWGEEGNYPHCVPFGLGVPCDPLISLSQRIDRLLEQTDRFLLDADADSELGTGADASGSVPSRFVWMPDCNRHAGSYDNISFNETRMDTGTGTLSMRQFLEAFMAAPATGATSSIIDGVDGATSICPTPPTPAPSLPRTGLTLLALGLAAGASLLLSRRNPTQMPTDS